MLSGPAPAVKPFPYPCGRAGAFYMPFTWWRPARGLLLKENERPTRRERLREAAAREHSAEDGNVNERVDAMKRIHYVMSICIAAGLALMLCERTATAQTPEPPGSLDLQQVALFKNGLGFFVGQATCPEGKTSFQIALPTAPSHGTFWISYPSALPVLRAIGRQTESGKTIDAITIPEILRANSGRKVRLVIGDKEVIGTIRYVAQDREMPRPEPYLPGGRGTSAGEYRSWPQYQAGLVTVETEAGELSLDPRIVTQVVFLDGKAERRLPDRSTCAVLEVQLKSPAAGQTLTVTYLGKGATWAPSYMVDITDAGKASISAKALIVNDACQFKNAAVQLVTGFPHLQFADIVSPIALKTDLAQFLQALTTGQSERGQASVMSNVMSQRAAYAPGPAEAAMPAYGAAEAGQTAEDLFLYPAGRIDMAKGEVAYVPLFTESVPYKHIYQWDIPDYVDEEGAYRYRGDRPDNTPPPQQVWHSIRLTNSTKVPWTTAPAETVKGGVILGQDTLSYTPPAAESTLRITQAVGVKAEQRELETDRKRDAAQLYGYSYDLVTVRGELSAINIQDKPVTLEITKMLSGEMKSADPSPKAEKLAAGLRRMNSVVKLTWTLELPPAAQKTLIYTYDTYVRR